MSHVDEGALHAYLDGALNEYPVAEAETIRSHLDRCSECAERLEVEHRIRADARAMLDLAAPEVELPSFEELRAYVDRTHRQRSAVTRLHRLGWAASVVLAVGAGWMLRDGQLQTRALDIGQDPILAPAEERALEARVATPESGGAGMTAPERTTPDAGAPAARAAVEADRAAESTGAQRPFETEGAVPAPEVGVPAEELTGRIDLPGSAVADATDSVDSVRTPGDVAPPPAVVTSAADELREERAAARETALALEEVIVAPPVPAPSAAADAASGLRSSLDSTAGAAGGGDVAAEPEERMARRRTESPVPVTSALRAAPQSTTFETVEADDEVPEGPLSSVPGFEVVEVRSLGDGTTPWGVRTVQRITEDVGFEVIRLEPGVDPSVLSAAEAGEGEVRAETESGWVLVRGALTAEILEDLLLRLLSG